MKNKNKIILGLVIILFCITGFFISFRYMTLINAENIEGKDMAVIKEMDQEELEEDIEEIIQIPEEPRISTINLLAVGDIMFHSPQYKAAFNRETKTYDFTPTFKYIKKYVENADIAMGNFETVTAGEEVPYSGFPRFNTPKESLLALSETGFDILSTANNHCIDQGKKGLFNTIDYIKEYHMKNIGTYKEDSDNILIEEIEGIKIGFLSYTYGLNGLDSLLKSEELKYMVNKIDETRIKEDIEKLKMFNVDLIAIYIHWGHEYHREPSAYQLELGNRMVEWGANIIFGSHPHVIQKSQIIHKDGKDNFIIYSMGNFLSNQRRETMENSYTEDGVMLNLEIEKDLNSKETIIKSVEYIPTWVYRYRDSNGKLNYEIIPIDDFINGELDIEMANSVRERILKSYRDTMDKMIEN